MKYSVIKDHDGKFIIAPSAVYVIPKEPVNKIMSYPMERSFTASNAEVNLDLFKKLIEVKSKE